MKYFILPLAFLFTFSIVSAQTVTKAQSVTGKVICGYQGWFNAYGDGSPVARWVHWSAGTYQSNTGSPAPGAIKFEAYPAVDEYNAASLFQTNLANCSDGTPAKLFSSYKADVIDKHFEWMQNNGIDGVALQRFISETFDGVFKANRDSIAARLKRSAESHQRIFYLMYDISGLSDTKFDSIKTDWQNNMEAKLHLSSSPYYVHQNGKPVVCLWGFGFTDRPGTAAQCLDVINWFKTNGCYVIGGVPTNWRTSSGDSKTGFDAVYKAYDMISPWSVGRFGDNTGADNFKTSYLVPDLAQCVTNGQLYQPVAFPGFAWSNWNGGTQNQIPRNKGEFFWRQLYNIKQAGIGNMYVAMFDEYDEGTAITKMADSYYAVPSNQYFLTTSADGTYLSSDFYMRLVGKATNVINGTDALTTNVTIPFSNGPVWFRSGFEQKYDALPDWSNSVDPSTVNTNIIGYTTTINPECGVVSETNHIGVNSLRYSGKDNSVDSSYIYFRVFQVNIPVSANTKLSFWTYPQMALSRYVSIDLIMSDGTTLRNSGATDTIGVSMHPKTGRGSVNTWQKTTCYIGQWLNGKTISRILVGYDHAPETGAFRGFVDDIAVYNDNIFPVPVKVMEFNGQTKEHTASLWWTIQHDINTSSIIVERSFDGNTFSALKTFASSSLAGVNSYHFSDEAIAADQLQVYYRLKFTDINGSCTYSNVIALSFKMSGFSFSVLPNPAKTYVQLNIVSEKNTVAVVRIIDQYGKTILTKSISVTKGKNAVILNDMGKYPRGMYVAEIIESGKKMMLPVIFAE